MIEKIYNQTVENYLNYLDLVWDIYYFKQTGVIPTRL